MDNICHHERIWICIFARFERRRQKDFVEGLFLFFQLCQCQYDPHVFCMKMLNDEAVTAAQCLQKMLVTAFNYINVFLQAMKGSFFLTCSLLFSIKIKWCALVPFFINMILLINNICTSCYSVTKPIPYARRHKSHYCFACSAVLIALWCLCFSFNRAVYQNSCTHKLDHVKCTLWYSWWLQIWCLRWCVGVAAHHHVVCTFLIFWPVSWV